jgi:hypothetical protein
MPYHASNLESFENPTSSKTMGISAGLTYRFNISPKLRPEDPLTINTEEQIVTKSVKQWIKDDAELIWHLIYDKHFKKSCSLSLCYNSLKLLTDKLKNTNPELLAEVQRRREVHKLRRKALASA